MRLRASPLQARLEFMRKHADVFELQEMEMGEYSIRLGVGGLRPSGRPRSAATSVPTCFVLHQLMISCCILTDCPLVLTSTD